MSLLLLAVAVDGGGALGSYTLVLSGLMTPGLVTDSILFCGLFTLKDQCAKVCFNQTQDQGMPQPGTSAPTLANVTNSTDKASQGPLKGTMSAQKALQGSKAEIREFL